MQPLTFVIMGSNPAETREIREALAASARTRVLTNCETSDQLLSDVLRLRPLAALIILEPANADKQFALIKQLTSAYPETAIITAAQDASPAMILGSMRSGAREFLQLPLITEEVQTVLGRVSEFAATNGNGSHGHGRIVGIFSSKGGTGVSFLSTNLAAAMNCSTLLVDLNLQTGDAASFLGLSPKYSLADFAANRNRVDDALISSLVTSHSENLALLAAPLEAHEAEDISSQDIAESLHLVGRRYQCVVLDLPHSFDPVTVTALDLADEVMLVMTMDIPGIRSTKRALKIFERLGYPRAKIRVVVNRWSKAIDVELQKVEAHLDERLVGFVPNDYPKVMESINLGRPLVQSEPSSKLTVEIKRLASLIAGNNHSTPSQPRKRLLGTVFGRARTPGSLELSAMTDPA